MRWLASYPKYKVRTSTSPSAGLGIGASLYLKSSSCSAPTGRRASSHWRLICFEVIRALLSNAQFAARSRAEAHLGPDRAPSHRTHARKRAAKGEVGNALS